MSNHNYSQYSNKNKKKNNDSRNVGIAAQVAYNKPKAEEAAIAKAEPVEVKMVVEPRETAAVANVEQSETTAKAFVETVETVTMPATVTSTVTGCYKLNVRAKPTVNAEVVTILNYDSKIEIDPARSTNEWLKITTAAGVEGFCMRKFISAKL